MADLIITGGTDVYSTGVEDVTEEYDGVSAVAVIGAGQQFGVSVKANIVPTNADNLTDEEVRSFADGRMAYYDKQKTADLVSKIPKTPCGEINKRKLSDRFWAGEGRQVW